MTKVRNEPVRAVVPTRSIAATRIRFVPHPVTGTRIRRSFKHPRPCLAVEQVVDPNELLRAKLPDASDTLDVVYVPPEARSEWEFLSAGWLAASSEPDAPETVIVTAQGDRIHWRTGRVVVEGDVGLRDEVLAGIVEFAFHESEVRSLEQQVEKHALQARDDVPLAFQIRSQDRAEWPRLKETIEDLAQLRLTFADLKPRVARGSRSLGKHGREVATRLFRAATTTARMEGLDNRLEACEDVYEGAVDRLADYRGWHTGHRLEVIIIALLVLEVLFMMAELLLRRYE